MATTSLSLWRLPPNHDHCSGRGRERKRERTRDKRISACWLRSLLFPSHIIIVHSGHKQSRSNGCYTTSPRQRIELISVAYFDILLCLCVRRPAPCPTGPVDVDRHDILYPVPLPNPGVVCATVGAAMTTTGPLRGSRATGQVRSANEFGHWSDADLKSDMNQIRRVFDERKKRLHL